MIVSFLFGIINVIITPHFKHRFLYNIGGIVAKDDILVTLTFELEKYFYVL